MSALPPKADTRADMADVHHFLVFLVSAAVKVIERRLILLRHLAVAAQMPAAHQIAEGVALRAATVGAAARGDELFLLDEQLGTAGLLRQHLDAAGALELDREE